VIRNDAISVKDLTKLKIKALVISPGPGHPSTDSGISTAAITHFAGKVPILGVCMGLQSLVHAYGGTITNAPEIVHGKLSTINHDSRGIFKGIPQSFEATRYHSLAADPATLPSELAVSAISANSGVIMAVRHRQYVLEAVQYHPESVISEHGLALFRNFLEYDYATWPTTTTSPSLSSLLENIHNHRIKDIAAAKITPGSSPTDLSTLLSLNISPPLIPVLSRISASQHKPALFAEIKRGSPSKGPIAPNISAPAQALAYALSGASLISVLTEPTFFKGSLTDLSATRAAIAHLPNRPAVLRKDFIIDEYQIAEARIHGADTVLLIVALLQFESRVRQLMTYARGLGMEPLVEVNNEDEMNLALKIEAKLIGINNRNLHDFTVDMETTTRLAALVPDGKDVVLCALSGISTRADVERCLKDKVDAVLVGEALMRADNPTAFISSLFNPPEPSGGDGTPPPPLVKICGIRTVEEAIGCADAGVDFIGFVFVPGSKRVVSVDDARRIASVLNQRSPPDQTETETETETPEIWTGTGLAPWFTTHARSINRERSQERSRSRPLLVGVFENATVETVREAVRRVPLDIVQLHGDEPVEFARWVGVPVIKAFSLSEGEGGEARRPGYHHFVLVDSVVDVVDRGEGAVKGGTGKTCDWTKARALVDRGEIVVDPTLVVVPSSSVVGEVEVGDSQGAQAPQALKAPKTPKTSQTPQIPHFPLPIILAGGLTPTNVRAAIDAVHPWAVDVSTGVERAGDGGKVGKDPKLVKRFVCAVRGEVYAEGEGDEDEEEVDEGEGEGEDEG